MSYEGETNLKELLELAIRVESTSGALYRSASGEMKEGKLRELLEALASAKDQHIEMLRSWNEGPGEMVHARYNAGLIGYVKRGEELSSRPGSSLLVVEFAINFEEEAIHFFESLRDEAGPDLGRVIQGVIEENGEFVERIRTLAYETLAGFRSPIQR